MTQARLKLLIPVEAGRHPRGALQYALRRQSEGLAVHVTLLFVVAPVGSGDLLWFRTREEIARFRAQAARTLLDDAARPLDGAGIQVWIEQRVGETTFEVADAAERLGCDEIVLPRQYPRWISLLAGDTFAELWHRERHTAMIAVDEDGVPLRRKPAIVWKSSDTFPTHAASRRPDHPPAPG